MKKKTFEAIHVNDIPGGKHFVQEHGYALSFTFGDAQNTLVRATDFRRDVEDLLNDFRRDGEDPALGCQELFVMLATHLREMPVGTLIAFDG